MLYWFKGFDASVTCIAQAPALDTCAIGLSDGRVVLHNLKYDSTLMKFILDAGPVTTIVFRNGSHGLDNPANTQPREEMNLLATENEQLYMHTGCANGQANSWELKANGESRSVGRTKMLHWERIVTMFCLPGGDSAGAMVTSGADNCVKVFYFDRPDGGPRCVYRRSGHFQPPNRIAFWPGGSAGGALLLSAGQDSMLRIFSTFNDNLDKSLGRAYAPGVPKRQKAKADDRLTWLLPGITQMSLCATRAEDWDSMVAIHTGRRQATTWNFVSATRGKHWLDPAKFTGKGGASVRVHKHTFATSTCITNCGNYVLLGYSSGDIIKFNLQSGIERGSYGDPTAHSSAVVGLAVNHVNRQCMSVGGAEIRFWSFHEHTLLTTMDLPSPGLFSRFHGDNDMLAVALEDGQILLLDATHHRIIRRFFNSELQRCVDLTISSDGRWLISAHHGDPLIKTWDIVHGKLIDCFRVNLPCTSLALSPGGDLLATTHVNSLGVHLWDNGGTYRRLQLQPLPDKFVPEVGSKPVTVASRSLITHGTEESAGDDWRSVRLTLRSASDVPSSMDVDSAGEEMDELDDPIDLDRYSESAEVPVLNDNYTSPEQLPDRLATLSGLSSTYLTSFLQLDLVRARNRAATDPERTDPIQLPFFLPVKETDQGLAWVDSADGGKDGILAGEEGENKKEIVTKRPATDDDTTLTAIEPVPGLTGRLARASSDEEFDEIMHTIKSLGPSALDLEIRLLAPTASEEEQRQKMIQQDLSQEAKPDTTVVEEAAPLLDDSRFKRDRLHGFLRLLLDRFERNLDVDLACVCLDALLQRHGELLLLWLSNRISSSTTSECMQHLLTETPMPLEAQQDPTWQLLTKLVRTKQNAGDLLTRRLTRSICLVDFVRHPTTALLPF